jgi:UDP-sugar pyrophosphorylase
MKCRYYSPPVAKTDFPLASLLHTLTPVPQELTLVEGLLREGQTHLFAAWPSSPSSDADTRRLLSQLSKLDASYAGGLLQYVSNARRLLRESREGVNPLEGWNPEVPTGKRLDFASEEFRRMEREGSKQSADAAFVLVAGGLGERLGYSGIKLELPAESASGSCFLQLYIEGLLALQAKARRTWRGPDWTLPLAIMTSDDTHARTLTLLESNAHFGANPSQVHVIKQEKVACLSDGDASLALDPTDAFSVQTKPHGHGDVHMLLHSTGLAQRWLDQGLRWVCFFQDTNALAFRAIPAALGVSATEGYDVNSLAVPRRAGEAIGAITKLRHAASGREMTINVEYNQLDPLLRATMDPRGDVDDATGFSPFPGILKIFYPCF